jgi:hypothetical protein
MKQGRIKFSQLLIAIMLLGIVSWGFNNVQAQKRNPGVAKYKLLVSRNGPDNAGEVAVFEGAFGPRRGKINVGNNEGIALDNQNNLFQCGDGKQGPGIRIFARIAERMNRRENVAFEPNRDREIKGEKTKLKNPKGIDIDEKDGLLFVAENGNSTILVFSSEAAGDVEPLATITTAAKPWDVEYDEEEDTLFVALVNGKVLVYEKFVLGGYAAAPTREFQPEGSVNLHGIVYDRAKDMLFLSDVGDAKSNDDGKIFVIKGASRASGVVKPLRTIEGTPTKLGNPVDIVYDGKDLYIAEKANDFLLVYKNIAVGQSGSIVPDIAVPDIKPEALIILND